MRTLLNILKWTGVGLVALIALFGLVYLVLPKGPRDPMAFDDPWRQSRPIFHGKDYVAVTGTPWATDAAVSVLDRGGNAFDAAVSALLMLNVTHGEAASFPSIAPLVIYDAQTGQVRSYTGAGVAPAAATIERFTDKGYKTVPNMNIWAQLVPASPDVIVSLLKDYGTMSFSELAAPAIQMAREGFPIHAIMAKNLSFSLVERIGFTVLMPYNSKVYIQSQWWRPVHHNDRLTVPDLANTLAALSRAEQQSLESGGTREQGLQAVRDYFYKGPLAQDIVQLQQDRGGLITAEDLANYSGYWEEPISGSYGDYTFYTNGAWTQGIVVPLTLQTLDGIDLKSMGHNSPAYVHAVTQAIELAMADREAYIGDPRFVDVPVNELMSKSYAEQRRAQMTAGAFGPLPAPGVLQSGAAPSAPLAETPHTGVEEALLGQAKIGQDTTQLSIVDRWGNAISLTPSDFPKTPMVPGDGMTLGDRMTQFRLDPSSPDALQPGKRPRVTPHALIVFKDGKFFMAYGTPGGDVQTQANVQVFLNMAVFGMDIQQAIEAPRFRTLSEPDSFAPHDAFPGTLWMEAGLYDKAGQALSDLGYTVVRKEDWDNDFGAVGAVIQQADGLVGGSDPREEGWPGGQ